MYIIINSKIKYILYKQYGINNVLGSLRASKKTIVTPNNEINGKNIIKNGCFCNVQNIISVV